MYSYRINCRAYPIPTIVPREKIYDLITIIQYFTSDMYKLSKITRTHHQNSSYQQNNKSNKKQFIEHKAREWLAERLNKLMLGTACINQKCQDDLRTAKSLIDNTYNNYFWDRVRVLANPYELIYFTCKKPPNLNIGNAPYVAAIEPLSRSFFKMIEMGNIFLLNLVKSYRPITTVHLAEGPGGFIEAIIWLRKMYKHICGENTYDRYYGITLIDQDSTDVPSWKRSAQFIQENPQVNILSGADGTGNLYTIANLKYLANRFSFNKADLVTADGGFDFSTNGYNSQEQMANKLILAEIIGCLAVLARNGTFICKFFDLNNKLTADLLYLIQCHFTMITIFKPKTSRLANSEKYIVATGFRGCLPETLNNLMALLEKWNTIDNENERVISQISTNWHILASKHTHTIFRTINSIFDVSPNGMELLPADANNLQSFKTVKICPPGSFYSYLNNVICEMNQLQINNINQTINIINRQTFYDNEWQDKTREKQLENARTWCLENGIPFI